MLNGVEIKVTCWLSLGRIESADTFCLVHIMLSRCLMENFGSPGNGSGD